MEFKNQNEHRAAIANTFLNMFKHQSNCDVSLVIAGRMMKAHKRILATFSTFFKEIFDELEANSSVATNLGANVAFLNYKYEHVEVLIKYMYTGIIRVSKDDWPSVLKCATDLGITAIMEQARHQGPISESATENKRKLDDNGKENRSNALEAKRSKNDPPKETVGNVSEAKKTEERTKDAEKKRDLMAEDILSGVSFKNASRTNDKSGATSSSSTSSNTQITKMSKPTRISETPKLDTTKTNDSTKKETISSKKETNSSSTHKLIPNATSTPKSHNNNVVDVDTRSRSQSGDSDDSMEYSPFDKTKSFGDKVKAFDSSVFAETQKVSPSARPDSTSTATKPAPPATENCGKCGKTFTKGTHLKESELPTPPAMCPMGCGKVMKMNRMLKDHLTKFHKVSLCEEK